MSRSGKEKPLHSVPNSRRVLRFDLDETFVLRFGGSETSKLIVNPKECIICMDRPREHRFSSCNHCVVCSSCSSELQMCQLCLSQIIGRENVMQQDTLCTESQFSPYDTYMGF